MGIQGLLQFLKDASEPISVRKYKGQTVAVDTYCWLHKGAFSCAEKLAKGEPTDQYVTYCMKFVDMLLTFGVKPILVFDGCNLPSKKEVETARRERRQANLQKGKQLLREGKTAEARDCFTRCVNVTPAMARDVIKAARTRGVDCIVAPYEADAQLAFLNKAGIAQAVITEDSDLLAFGCKKVILKMDKLGNGLEVEQCNLGRCRALGDVFTEEKFRYMCILSGCDYLASLYGIGVGKACKLLRVASNPDILKVIRKMGQYLKTNVTVSDEYVEGFVKANNTFLYQLVFDPIRRKVVPLNPYPDEVDPASLDYAGHNVGDVKGLQMALGNMDFHTQQKIDDYNPDAAQVAKPPRSRGWNDRKEDSRPPETSIWRKGYTPGVPPPSVPPVPPGAPHSSPERPSTKGRERVVQGRSFTHRELPVKRPREESAVSEEDILQQYSSSSSCALKRQRQEENPPTSPAEGPTTVTAIRPPRPRNRFATLLQRRNQDDRSGDDQGTRSRFFSSVGSSVGSAEGSGAEGSDPGPRQPEERLGAGEEIKAEETEGRREGTTPSPPSSRSPQPARRGGGVFSWPTAGGCNTATPTRVPGLSALQRFQRTKDACAPRLAGRPTSTSPPCHGDDHKHEEQEEDEEEKISPSSRCPQPASQGLSALQRFQRTKDACSRNAPYPTGPPQSTSPPCHRGDHKHEETPPDSPPSQDSAYFSQPGPRSPVGEEDPPQSQHRDSTAELNTSQGSDCSESTSCAPVSERRPAPIGAKVSGLLPRVRSGDPVKRGKVQAPSGPARPSGLRRKKPAGPGNRAGAGNENTPGLQATISGLWKNFCFQKERPKMNPGARGEPLSPVKANVSPPTPGGSEDVYFVSESAHRPKTVCL